MYANGDTVKKDHAKAIEIVNKFAQAGNSNAMIQIGDLYSCYDTYSDFDRAEAWYTKAINNNDNYAESAKVSLALFYNRRYLNTHDLQYVNLYINWLTTIANEGNTRAMYLLAREYQDGQYISKDYHIALAWLKKSRTKRRRFSV